MRPSDSQQIIHIHPRAPAKPAVGAICNGCGICCLSEPCPIGMLISRKRQGQCQALRWSDASGRYVCGLLAEPESAASWRRSLQAWLRPLLRRWIAAGQGCDCELLPQSPSSGQATSREAQGPG
ncbi:hypothetical protein DBR47_00990 [Paucibacter sp. KBW04]|uniref:hypothetical protein n=1 Tax=Paucibacter sp. KBW04 TaxID=2153361 RepID=UPI000F577FDC|nr:hypothetical protein DBR47_00990 [Paucibacter sp. KBW04]